MMRNLPVDTWLSTSDDHRWLLARNTHQTMIIDLGNGRTQSYSCLWRR